MKPEYLRLMSNNTETFAGRISRRLREIRKAHNQTQATWALAAGVPQTTISDWETGDSLSQLDKIDAALRSIGADPAELFAPTAPAQEELEFLKHLRTADGRTRQVVMLILKSSGTP